MAYDRVSELGSLTLDYSAGSGMTVQVYVWLEGAINSGVPTKTLTFPAAAKRTQVTLPLDDLAPATPVEGSYWQISVTSAGVFRLFGGKLTHRPIPVYRNGAASPAEKWLSPVLSIEGL